jgi:hypothetical protein
LRIHNNSPAQPNSNCSLQHLKFFDASLLGGVRDVDEQHGRRDVILSPVCRTCMIYISVDNNIQ